MNQKDEIISITKVLFFATVIVVVAGMAFSGGAAALNLNADDGNRGNVTSGATAQPIGELQFIEGSPTVSQRTISFPSDLTVNESASSIQVTSRNMTSQDVTINSPESISVSFDTVDDLSGGDAALNITGVRVDVDPSVGNATRDVTATESVTLNVSGLTVGTNKTVNMTRGQNGVGPQNVTLFPNEPVSGGYTVQGPDNRSLIAQGSEIAITIPDGEDRISFDTGASVTVSSNVSSNAVVNGSQATVNSGEISFTATEGNLSVNEAINVTGIQYDTSGLTDPTVAANFTTNLTVETTAENPVSTRSQTAAELDQFGGNNGISAVNVERPGLSLNKTINLTSGQSNTTRFNVTVQDATIAGGALGADTQVVIDIPGGTGVTFNTSDSAPPVTGQFNTSDIQDRVDSGIAVSPTTVTVSVNNSTGGANGNIPASLNVTNLTVDAQNGISNQTINLTVTTTANKSADAIAQNTSIGTTINGSNQIVVANGNQVQGDVNASVNGFNFGSTGSSATQNLTGNLRPGDSITAAINVTDRFGGQPEGITVNLNASKNPSDSSILSTDSVVSNETGLAVFDVTLGDSVGIYNVTATLAHNASANVTLQYRAAAGQASDIVVTGINNSVTDTSGIGAEARSLEQAAYRVRVTDANDNPVNTSAEVNIETSGSLENVTYNLSRAQGSESGPRVIDNDNDGRRNYNATKITNGGVTEFFIFVSSEQPGDETVTVSSGGVSDTGTATVFDSTIDSVNVSIDKTSPSAGEEFNVTAVGNIGGNTVEVSGISASFEVADSAVAFLDSSSASTSTSGQASVSGEALTAGETQINVTFDDPELASPTTGSVDIGTQQSEPTASVTFDDQSVDNGSTSVNVASARFDGTEDFVIVVHRASPGDNGVVDSTDEIGNKIGSSDVLSGNVSDVSVNLTKSLDEGGNTQLTEDQTLIAMLHFANESGDTNFGSPITRGGSPVFDQAEITVEDTVNIGGEDVPVEFTTTENGERTVTATNAIDAIDAFRNDNANVSTVLSVIDAFRNESSQ
uniref:Uncharacterized protein n=1 Tax=uncultured haloarchaeon TaxID=160804 RepID=A0A0K1YBN0_9EURY|nr:hypothetical protein [uncultured haloarchaeon]